MDMTLDKFKYLNSICWNEKYQAITIDMTKDENTGHYRLGLYCPVIPNKSRF